MDPPEQPEQPEQEQKLDNPDHINIKVPLPQIVHFSNLFLITQVVDWVCLPSPVSESQKVVYNLMSVE